jgi:hypothetical protein
MAYRIRRNKSIKESVRVIAGEQIERSIAEINDPQLDRHEAVHQARKRCKKLRALVRIVRPQFADYKRENAFFRDAARELSYLRDAQSVVACFDGLMKRHEGQVDSASFAAIRQELVDRRSQVAEDVAGLDARLGRFLEQMHEAHQRVAAWEIDDNGFSAVRGGLNKTYARGRKALLQAHADSTTDNFHEWRKRVKYHWYHERLLRQIWPAMMKVERRVGNELAGLLGDEHDLAVLQQTLDAEPERFGEERDRQELADLIKQSRAQLQSEAYQLGARIFAEQPDARAERFQRYWMVWQRD